MGAVQARGNGAAIAALTRLMHDSGNNLGQNVNKTGQDVRSNNVNELIGNGALEGMDANQARNFIMANSKGSLNEQSNKNVQTLLADKASQEAAAIKEQNALGRLGIQINANQVQNDANNVASGQRNDASIKGRAAQGQKNRDSRLAITKLTEKGKDNRQQDWTVLGNNWGMNRRTGEFRSPGGQSMTKAQGYSEFGKGLTGNQKDFFSDLSDNQKGQFMEVKSVNPHLNIIHNGYTDSNGVKRKDGYTVVDGSGNQYQLEDAYKRIKDFEAAYKKTPEYRNKVTHGNNHGNQMPANSPTQNVDELMYGF